MALPAATDVEYVGANASGGVSLGLSDGKVSFYGATPVTKQTLTQQTTKTTTALRTDLDRVMSLLSTLGLATLA